ncbi:MAG: hypothetical protein C0483_01440 [Pirellula sp.]|nr:hypothetical protein [Pirellula sp.]
MSRTTKSNPGTAPGQGNAGIAKLVPLERQESERDTAGEELTPKAGQSPHVATAVQRSAEGQVKPEKSVENSRVDEAAWESFPASDPPSSNTGTSTPADG